MAEETNNQAPLTAREVAAANPELDKLRQIAFGTNYLDDIDAGTGTARFYSGFGQQPTYTGTNTDQAIADAVTAQAETVAAPDQSSGNGQETSGGITGVSGLQDNSMYGGDLDQGGAGDGITNYENTPDETIQQQEDINFSQLSIQPSRPKPRPVSNSNLVINSQITGTPISPNSFAQQANNNYNSLSTVDKINAFKQQR